MVDTITELTVELSVLVTVILAVGLILTVAVVFVSMENDTPVITVALVESGPVQLLTAAILTI